MQIGLSYSPLRLSRHRISDWFLDDNNTQYSIGESACDKSEPSRVFTWNSARENHHKIHALLVLFTNIICIYIKLYKPPTQHIATSTTPWYECTQLCQLLYYYFGFAAMVYGIFVCKYYSLPFIGGRHRRRTARILSEKEIYLLYMYTRITCAEKKQHRPRTVTRTNTRACI